MRYFTALIMAVALVACGSSNAANRSDMQAVYSGADGAFRMTVELSESGDLRGETQGQDMWMLRTDGLDYFVIPDDEGDKVLDVRIMGELMREIMSPEFLEMTREAPVTEMELERIGEVTVNGRTGIGYRMPGAPEGFATFVFSDDPDLAPLRDAMATPYETSMAMMPIETRLFSQTLELLREAAPLRFANADLESFEPADFDDNRFELPADPLDKDATREVMISRGMIPAEPIELPDFTDEAQ